MDTDLSTFELALLRTERDIASADDEMARLESEIVRMRAEIAKIANQRAGFVDLSIELKKRLGQEVPVEARSGGESRQDEADGNDAREYDRHYKEVFPAEKSDYNEAGRQAPTYDPHLRQMILRQTSQLPCQDRSKQQKDRYEEAETNIKVPICPVQPLHFEMRRPQRRNN